MRLKLAGHSQNIAHQQNHSTLMGPWVFLLFAKMNSLHITEKKKETLKSSNETCPKQTYPSPKCPISIPKDIFVCDTLVSLSNISSFLFYFFLLSNSQPVLHLFRIKGKFENLLFDRYSR